MSQTKQSEDNDSEVNDDCVVQREWCDGPDVEQLEDGALFGGICGDCYFERLEGDIDE